MKKYDICVFGGCSLDMTFFQNEDGSYPTVPAVCVPGGKGSNQAVAASRAGSKVVMISRIGKDETGYAILDNLLKNGVDISGVDIVDGLSNDSSKIYVENNSKDNHITREIGAIDSFTTDMIEKNKDIILGSKMVVAQMKAPKEVSVALINFCHENNIPITVTPCRPDKLAISEAGNAELIDKISYITANKKECETIFGTSDITKCIKKYPNKLIVTLGDKGVTYYDGKKVQKFDPLVVENIVDTTGAGDTFNGNLTSLIVKDVPLKTAIEKAQFASAMKLSKMSAQAGMPKQDELEEFIREYNSRVFFYRNEFNMIYKRVEKVSEDIKMLHRTITRKPDKTFVTESDIFIENYLISEIKKHYPNDNFVTEENNPTNEITDRTWVIDPIDGTHHYMKNSIFWGIQLAFVDKGETQFSIIYLPKLGEMYYALKDYGTYLNHIKISFDDEVTIDQCCVEFCGSIHKLFEEKSAILKKITLEDIKVANIMHINACCTGFTNLISGRTDAMILSTKKPWDILPGMFLVKEYGLDLVKLNNLELYSKCSKLTEYLTK